MADDVAPVVQGIQKRFRDLSVDVREERVIRYLVNQVRLGRHVDSIMSDAYVVGHTSQAGRDQILQNPRIIKAIEQEIERRFASYQAETDAAGSAEGDIDRGEDLR